MKQNCVRVNLQTNQTDYGMIKIPDEKIKASAEILANLLLDYVSSGGSTNDLTPSKVFGNGGKQ